MADRNEESFWAVWADGIEWPALFAHEPTARDAAHNLAKGGIGRTVHLMRIKSVGTVQYPSKPLTSGALV